MSTHVERETVPKPPKRVFFAAFVFVFFSAFSASDSVGFVPCQFDDTCGSAAALSDLPPLSGGTSVSAAQTSLPTRIEIPAIAMDLPVQNIESTDINVLYEDLKQGPIRYAASARLGEDGNVLIFGHSSQLPIVKNRMYKAFNRISELKAGDTITLAGDDGAKYLYSVVSVEQKDIKDPTAIVSFGKDAKRLTLITCDTLTGKSARFVLTADYVGTI